MKKIVCLAIFFMLVLSSFSVVGVSISEGSSSDALDDGEEAENEEEKAEGEQQSLKEMKEKDDGNDFKIKDGTPDKKNKKRLKKNDIAEEKELKKEKKKHFLADEIQSESTEKEDRSEEWFRERFDDLDQTFKPKEDRSYADVEEEKETDQKNSKYSIHSKSSDISLMGENGSINGTWSGIVNITEDVYVQNGDTLTIEPGTEIYFNDTTQPTMYINGTLEADGAGDEILFTSNASNPSIGDWGGIYFNSSADEANSIINNANISYADYGITFNQTSPPVTNCDITMNQEAGVAGSEMNISNNNISMNGDGIWIPNNNYLDTLNGTSGPIDIHDNQIMYNNNRGIFVDETYISRGTDMWLINITGNQIGSNGMMGIYASYAPWADNADANLTVYITIENNDLMNNGGHGVYLWPFSSQQGTTGVANLTSNIVLRLNNASHNDGEGIYVESQTYAQNDYSRSQTTLMVDSNEFYNNTGSGFYAENWGLQNVGYDYMTNMSVEIYDNMAVMNDNGFEFISRAEQDGGATPDSILNLESWNNMAVNNTNSNFEVKSRTDATDMAYSNVTANFVNEEAIGHNHSKIGMDLQSEELGAGDGASLNASISESYIYNNMYGVNAISVEINLHNNEIMENGYPTTGPYGTDAYGYTWDDTAEYNWIDTTGGTPISLNDDDYELDVPLGFQFDYYGISYDSVNVMSNGWLSFVDSETQYNLNPVPNEDIFEGSIAPFADDLDPTEGGNIYYDTFGSAPNRYFVLEYHQIQNFGGGNAKTMEVIFYENSNDIKFQYQTAPDDPDDGLGIEDQTEITGIGNGASGDNYIDPATVDPGVAIKFSHPSGTGIQILKNSQAELTNNMVKDNANTGLYTDGSTTANWHVNDHSEMKNNSVHLNGDMIVEEGGYLMWKNGTIDVQDVMVYGALEAKSGSTTQVITNNVLVDNQTILDNATWKIDSSYDGEYHINVTTNGDMTVRNGSVITRNQDFAYEFWVHEGGMLQVIDSSVYYCGWNGPDMDDQGLWINSDSVWLNNSTVGEGYTGAIVYEKSPYIQNSTFNNSANHGIMVYNTTSLTLERNMIYDNGMYGIYIDISTVDIAECEIYENGNGGIFWQDTEIDGNIYESWIAENGGHGVTFDTVGGNLTIMVQNFYGNNISSNQGNGIMGSTTENLTVMLTGNSNLIYNNDQYGIQMGASGESYIELQSNVIGNGYSGVRITSGDNLQADIYQSNFSANGWDGVGYEQTTGLLLNSDENISATVSETVANENGDGTDGYGILVWAVENCTATLDGIETNANHDMGTVIIADSNLHLEIRDTMANENGDGTDGYGIYANAVENVTASLENVNASENDEYGIYGGAGTDLSLTMIDSVTSYNGHGSGGNGTYLQSAEDCSATFDNVAASYNDYAGIHVYADENLTHLEIRKGSEANYNGNPNIGYGIYAEAGNGELEGVIKDDVTASWNNRTGIMISAWDNITSLQLMNSVTANWNDNYGILVISEQGYIDSTYSNVEASYNMGDDGIHMETRNGDITTSLAFVKTLANEDYGIYIEASEDITSSYSSVKASDNINNDGIHMRSVNGNITTTMDSIMANDNGDDGIELLSNFYVDADLTEVSASNNSNRGILIVSDNYYIYTTMETITANDNGNDGIEILSATSLSGELADIEAWRNDVHGVYLDSGSSMDVTLSSSIINYNDDNGVEATSASSIDFTMTDVEIIKNAEDGTAGARIISGSTMTLSIDSSTINNNYGYGIYPTSGSDMTVSITNTEVMENENTGVFLDSPPTLDLTTSNTDIRSNDGYGIWAVTTDEMMVDMENDMIMKNTNDGLYLMSGGRSQPINGTITGLLSQNNEGDGVNITHGGDLVISESEILDNEDMGLRLQDSLFTKEEYSGGEIITVTARPVIQYNVISDNGNTSHESHPGDLPYDQDNGLYIESSCPLIRGNTIENNWNNGITIWNSGWNGYVDLTVEDNTIRHNYIGLTSENSMVHIDNNVITYNRGSTSDYEGGGIYSLSGSDLDLLNNQISYNLMYGIWTDEDSRTDWKVTNYASVMTNTIVLRGDLKVRSGTFHIEDVKGTTDQPEFKAVLQTERGFYFRTSLNNRFGIDVDSSGKFKAHDTFFSSYNEIDSYTFEVAGGSHLQLENCRVDRSHSIMIRNSEAGIHGTIISNSSHGGIEIYDSSTITISKNTIENANNFGIYLESTNEPTISNVDISSTDVGIEAYDSNLKIVESSIEVTNVGVRAFGDTDFEMHASTLAKPSDTDYEDFYLSGQSNGSLYGVLRADETIEAPDYELRIEDDSELDVYWYIRAKVVDVYKDPVENTTVNIYDSNGEMVANLTTDHWGLTQPVPLHSKTYTASGVIDYSPHEFISPNRSTTEMINQPKIVTVGPGKDPEFVSEPVVTVAQDSEYYYNSEAVDPTNYSADLVYSLVQKPEGMSIDSMNGEISWTPTATQVGTHTVMVKAKSLDTSRSTTQEFTIKVTDINDAPEIRSSPIKTAVEDKEYLYHVEGYDVDGDTLGYTLITAPEDMDINSGGVITWMPSDEDVGNHTIVVEVTDGEYSAVQEYNLMVKNTNDDPEIVSDPITTVMEDNTYGYQVVAEDMDGDDLSFSLVEKPEGMSIDSQTGMIEWTPTQEHVGTHDIEVHVQDGKGGSVSQTYTIEVENRNSKPFIENTSVSIEEGTTEDTFTFMVTVRDEDGEAPSNVYVVINGEKIEMNRTSGESYTDGVVYTAQEKLDAGNNHYYFFVEDADGRTATTSAQTLEVEETETPWMASIGVLLLIILIILVGVYVYFREYREEPEESEENEMTEETESIGEVESDEELPGFEEEEVESDEEFGSLEDEETLEFEEDES